MLFKPFCLYHSTSKVLGKHVFNNSYKRVVVLGMFYVFGGWNLYNCILNHTSTGFYIEYSQVIKQIAISFSKSGQYHQLFLLIFWPRCWLFLPVETRFNFTPLFSFFFSQGVQDRLRSVISLGSCLAGGAKTAHHLRDPGAKFEIWIWMDGRMDG